MRGPLGTERGSLRTAGDGLLADAGAGLDAALSLQEAMDRLARFVCERIADVCTVTVLADGTPRHVAADHRDPALRAAVRDYVGRWQPNMSAPGGVGDVAAHRRPTLIEPVSDAVLARFAAGDADRLAALQELRLGTMCVVPLVARDRVLGTLGMATQVGGRPLTPLDLPFLEELGRRAALALDNARLLEDARRAQATLEHALRRQTLVAAVGAALEDAADAATGAQGVTRLLVDRGLADLAAIDVPQRDGRLRRLAAAAGPALDADVQEAGRLARFGLDHPRQPVARALRDGARQVVALDAAPGRPPLREGVCEPLAAGGRVVGVLSLGSAEGASLHEADPALLADVAGRVALGLAAATARTERETIAAQLQEALLPAELPDVPGVALAARHVAGAAGLDVGGDFYDVFEASSGGAWSVVIGDVCGKGAQAAVITAMARYTVRALAMQRSGPADLLAGTNAALLRQDDALRFVTMVAARLVCTPDGARVDLASAGHPPPLVARADGRAEVVPARGPLLGVRADPVYLDEEVHLGPGDALVLYTDGLTDLRGDAATPEELAGLAAGAVADGPQAIIEALEARATRSGPAADDLAVLVVSPPAAGR